MTRVLINNSEQKRVEQQVLINQLVDNGLMSTVGKVYKKRGIGGLAKMGQSIGGGMARKAGKSIGTQAKAAGIQVKRGGLRAGKFAKSPAGKMTGMGAGLGATAGAGMGVGMAMGRRKKR